MHCILSKESAKSAYLKFGRELFQCVGLCFGLTISPSTFQMMNNVLVSFLISHLHYCLLYLDDRLSFSTTTRDLVGTETTISTYCMLLGLVSIGGFLSIDKSVVIPTRQLDFLGLDLDTEACTVAVPKKKHDAFVDLVREFRASGPNYSVKQLERLRGKVISWLLVVTNAKLWIREMNLIISECEKREWSTVSHKYLTTETELFRELDFWTSLSDEDLVRGWLEPHHGLIKLPKQLKTHVLYTDASTYKLGGCLLLRGKRKYWSISISPDKYREAIHVKEFEAVVDCVVALKEDIRGGRVKLMCDNASCVASWNGDGCRDPKINRLMVKLYYILKEIRCKLDMVWVSTKSQLADDPSRLISEHDDSVLRPALRDLIKRYLEPNLDCFADKHNAIVPRFISRYDDSLCYWVDGLSYSVASGDRLYLYPPRSLITACLDVLVAPSQVCMMVIHEFKDFSVEFAHAKNYFDHCVPLGGRLSGIGDCCSSLTISAKKRNICKEVDGYKYYRSPNQSFLLVKGVGETALRSLVDEIKAFHDWSVVPFGGLQKISRNN